MWTSCRRKQIWDWALCSRKLGNRWTLPTLVVETVLSNAFSTTEASSWGFRTEHTKVERGGEAAWRRAAVKKRQAVEGLKSAASTSRKFSSEVAFPLRKAAGRDLVTTNYSFDLPCTFHCRVLSFRVSVKRLWTDANFESKNFWMESLKDWFYAVCPVH